MGTALERIPTPTRAEFVARYLRRRRPVVITGALDGWPACIWDHKFFADRYGDEVVEVIHWTHQSGSRRTTQQPALLREYLELIQEPTRWRDPSRPPYLEAFGLLRRRPELLRSLGALPFFPNWLEHLPADAAYRIYGWKNLLLSPRGAIYNLHYDDNGVHAILLQLSGHKRMTMFPPDEDAALYGGAVDPEAPDLARFPRFKNATGRMEVEIHPGDAVFIPSFWWHQVRTVTPSTSVVVHAINRINVAAFAMDFGLMRLNHWLARLRQQRRHKATPR